MTLADTSIMSAELEPAVTAAVERLGAPEIMVNSICPGPVLSRGGRPPD